MRTVFKNNDSDYVFFILYLTTIMNANNRDEIKAKIKQNETKSRLYSSLRTTKLNLVI